MLNKDEAPEVSTTLLGEQDANLIARITLNENNHLSEGTITYRSFKRLFDIIFASLGLLILLPLLLFISIIIKIEDPRASIFFIQERVGKNNKKFKMYKFRSMISDAEDRIKLISHLNEVSGPMFKMQDDPRVTKIGKMIRKTSIDELPQLLNVIKGEMSLVGPRPALPREVNMYSNYHMKRLIVVPGCTGLWQSTVRNSVGFEEMVELDLEYIKSKSMIYDIKIIINTVKILIKPTGV